MWISEYVVQNEQICYFDSFKVEKQLSYRSDTLFQL